MPTTPPGSTPLPTPPTTLDPDNFDSRMDAWLTSQVAFQTEENALAANVYANAVGAYSNAVAAQANATAAVSSAVVAAASAGAQPWASGTYAFGVVVYSPINYRLYRKSTASSMTTTDPSADPANWFLISPANTGSTLYLSQAYGAF